MTKSQYELIIIGAGVVGMGAALAAHKKGIKKNFSYRSPPSLYGSVYQKFWIYYYNGASAEVDAKKSLTISRNMVRSCQESKNYC